MTTDKEHLQWIHDRIVEVYGESKNVDFLIRMRKIIDKQDDTELNLHSFRQQRELLIAFAKYMEEDKMYERHDEANVDDFLENYSN